MIPNSSCQSRVSPHVTNPPMHKGVDTHPLTHINPLLKSGCSIVFHSFWFNPGRSQVREGISGVGKILEKSWTPTFSPIFLISNHRVRAVEEDKKRGHLSFLIQSGSESSAGRHTRDRTERNNAANIREHRGRVSDERNWRVPNDDGTLLTQVDWGADGAKAIRAAERPETHFLPS